MTSFDKIKNDIASEIKNRPDVASLATKKTNTPVTEKGMPDVAAATSGVIGTVVSTPGTEVVMLDGATFQLMECMAPGRPKKRFTVVEKNTPARYGNQFINSRGERVHVITHDLYNILTAVLHQAGRQISQLTKDIEHTKEQRDLYKMTIDALKKNGVID